VGIRLRRYEALQSRGGCVEIVAKTAKTTSVFADKDKTISH